MKKQVLIAALLSVLCTALQSQVPLANAISDKLSVYNRILPCEKVYVQCDRPFYKPGDDIWMALWITGANNAASEVSEIVTVELINPKGTVEQVYRVLATKGRAICDFNIDTSAVGGIYKIKAYTNWMLNFGQETAFVKEIQVQQIALPRLRMRLDIDRKAYGPNDTVKARLALQTLGNQPLSKYDFSYTVNLDGEEFLKSRSETNTDGKAEISFVLPPRLLSGDGLLNVTINYKGNPESISRSIPINIDQIDLQFFPEGGDLVVGSVNNCAFKALNEYGKPADITGTIFNSKHAIITTFRSFHHGMGAFRFTPQAGEKYYALIDRPEGIMQLYPLPQAINNGYIMEIPEAMQFLKAESSQANIRIVSPGATRVLVLAQMQGNIVLSSYFNCQKGENNFTIPLSAFKTGVAQITLFTNDNVEVCERLVFVKKHKQMNVSVTTDKRCYLPREKVKLNISTTDAQGKPVAAQLGLAVADDKLLSMADDKSDNILSYLLLSSDVKGTIEEPSFYFNPQEAKADSALDYLLLTQGWRRFTWEEIVETPASEWIRNCEYSAEKRILSGTITSSDKLEIEKTRLYIKETKQTAQVNADGYYEFRDLDLTTPLTLVAVTGNHDTIVNTIKDYTSVNSLREYYYNHWDKSLKGIVRDKETGDPLPGANVLIKGTTTGTVSDLDGRFNLNFYESAPLVISFMGYQTVEIFAKPSKTYEIELEKDIIRLDDIIVVGYGIQRKRLVTGSVVRVQHTRHPVKVETKQDNTTQAQRKKALQPQLDKTAIPQNRPEGTTIQIPEDGETMDDMVIVEEEPVFCIVEIPATFQGGDLSNFQRWISNNIRYPQVAIENNIEGKVYVKFFVDKQGYVQNPEIVRSLHPSCDEEVLRYIKTSPRWSPARQMGRPVDSYFIIAVNFRMAEPSTGYYEEEKTTVNNNPQSQYYRARKFYVPAYSPREEVEVRTDFRKTIYWNPLVSTDNTGKAQLEFFTSDELTTFRATAEGIDQRGNIGRNEYTFHTSKPLSLDASVPEIVNFEDTLFIPVTIKNTSPDKVTGTLQVEYPGALVP
ncbi:MAG TPA: TonB family protein [Bacteroidales bacterium]|nr:TonB family protein [Bacteroidales bacterium]